ncbi:Pre-rRNA-processing protein ipi3 [Cytospora paraplurivora]|uniref:Pre-rRNA-processing protein IPI3 n=1 Tax=Cytospora paraplurivora TaxID=2898453 RepID=A0AAN9UI76_9PEZI
MLTEEFYSSVCGPPLSSNTAIAKDVGIYSHSLWPTFAAKSTFRKSATGPHSLAVNETHVFAAQHEKGYVHVYSRLRGNQEAFVAFPERIRCLTLAGDVVVVGTVEGRIMLWEAVSCVTSTPHYLLTGSDDSNVQVWSLAQLLERESNGDDQEPLVSFSNHRGAITAVAAAVGDNPETSICVSASKDKTCIIWNYRTGAVLRTLLFPASPISLALDPCQKGVYVSTEDASIFSVEFFGPKPLLGPDSEDASTVVQVSSPFCTVPPESGPASCLGLTYDGTVLLSGHPKGQIHAWSMTESQSVSGAKVLTNLNAAVTNIAMVPPLTAGTKATKALTIIKPSDVQRAYNFTAQYEADLKSETSFQAMVKTPGFSPDVLETAISAFLQPADNGADEEVSQRQIDEQWEILNMLGLSAKAS